MQNMRIVIALRVVIYCGKSAVELFLLLFNSRQRCCNRLHRFICIRQKTHLSRNRESANLENITECGGEPFTGRETVLWLFTGKIDSHLGPNGMGPLPSLRFQCCVCSCRKLSLSAVDVATFADVIPNHNFTFKSFQAIRFNENWGVSYAHKFPFRSGSGQAIGKAVHGRTSIEVIRPKHG